MSLIYYCSLYSTVEFLPLAFESNKSPSRSFTRDPVRTLVFYSRKSMDHVLLFTGPGGQMIPVDRLGPIMIGRLFDLFRTRTVLVPISSSFGPGPYFVLIRSSSRPRPVLVPKLQYFSRSHPVAGFPLRVTRIFVMNILKSHI